MKIKNREIPLQALRLRNFSVLSGSLAVLIFLTAFRSEEELNAYSLNGFGQGTSYHISYYDTQQSISKAQIDSILTKIDSSLSIYKSYSLITAFNGSKTGVQMDRHFKTVMEKSLEISKKKQWYV